MTATVDYTTASGKVYKLPHLRCGQICDLADELHRHRRDFILAGAAVSQMADAEKRRLVLDFEEQPALAAQVLRWAFTARGTQRIIEESLKLFGNGLTIDELGVDLTRDYRIAVDLLGFRPSEIVDTSAAPNGETGEDADPTRAAPLRDGT